MESVFTLPPRAQEAGSACAYCSGPLPQPRVLIRKQPSTSDLQFCCYGCRLLGESGRKAPPGSGERDGVWIKVGIGAALFGQMMLLDLAVNLTAPEGDSHTFLHWTLLAGTLFVFALLGPNLVRAVREDFPRPTLDLMFLAGILGAFGASVHSTLTGVGAVYYEVVAVLLTVYTAGKTLGARSRARAFAEAQRLHDTFATCRCLQSDGSVLQKQAAQVQIGEQVRVLAGEPIPIDGKIIRGQAFVQEGPLTGEPYSVVRRAGDDVLAGSYSEDGDLIITATREGGRRRLDELLALATAARGQPARIQAQADRVIYWLLPLVLMIASGTFLFWSWRAGWAAGLFNALAVLVVACPCAMGLATPVALWNAMAALAARGLVVRDADAIENLARLTHVAFDKTGTLSEDSCSVIDLATEGTMEERGVILALVHAVEARSSHPVARAFHSFFAEADEPAFEVRSLQPVPAHGIEACLLGADGTEHHVRLGQRAFMTDLALEASLMKKLSCAPGDQLVYVQISNRLSAIAAVRERLRLSAIDIFSALKELGVGASVLTGDSQRRAAELGLENAEGSLTPMAKAERVAAMQKAGERVGFAGDGANDAPAMNAASVGLALAHGAGLTQATASAVLYGGDMRVIPWAIDLCRHVRRSIHSNLGLSALYNCIGITLAVTGHLHPVAAMLLMVVSSLLVSWRAMRVARRDDFCCDPAQSKPRNARAGLRRLQSALGDKINTGKWNVSAHEPALAGLLIALQGPFIIYLGRLSFWLAIWLVLALSILGVAVALLSQRIALRPPGAFKSHWQMNVAMLGIGNWGMLLGWWVEAGFGPVMREGATLGCCVQALLSPDNLRFPWMYVGMLLFGLPPMISPAAPGESRLAPWLSGFLSATGMVVGMAWGGAAGLDWAGATPASKFLWFLGGMIGGMMLGMSLGCELGRMATVTMGECQRARRRKT
jgi:heavy metal translocating P-type ATPase